MKKSGMDILVVGLALFSMFFGAGNVIFPPYLGVGSGSQWFSSFACYYMADIGLALVALFAMLRLNTDMDGITRRIGKIPSKILGSAIVLCIGPFVAIPRTAASTFEMSIAPLFSGISPIVLSVVFFAIVFALCINESSVVDIIGKILTPALFAGLLLLIIVGIVSPIGEISQTAQFENVYVNGITSGYQTLDVLAALMFGILLLNTVKQKGYKGSEVAKIVGMGGVVAGIGLLIIYCGLTYLGATVSTMYGLEVGRAALVVDIVQLLLGRAGIIIFAVVVALACLTTAIGLTTCCGDYFSRLSNKKVSYRTVVIITCVFSLLISNIGLDMIVSLASPILDIVYPAALVLILLSYIDEKIENDNVYKFATIGALLVSVLTTISNYGVAVPFVKSLPLASLGFSWIIPAIIFGIIGNFVKSSHNVGKAKTND